VDEEGPATVDASAPDAVGVHPGPPDDASPAIEEIAPPDHGLDASPRPVVPARTNRDSLRGGCACWVGARSDLPAPLLLVALASLARTLRRQAVDSDPAAHAGDVAQ
jgi:hypothetical protein